MSEAELMEPAAPAVHVSPDTLLEEKGTLSAPPIQAFPVAEAGSPQSEPPPGGRKRKDKPEPVPIPEAEQGRMLIADDEPFVRNIVQRIFDDREWFIEECASHQEIMDRLLQQAFRFDIAVLDITMPGPPVENLVHAITERHPNVRILLISGFDHNERVDQMTQHPAVEFMAKPFSPKALTEKVDEIISASV